MSNTYKNRELMTLACNADNTISCCLVWYRNAPIEYVVFSPRPNGRVMITTFLSYITAIAKFEELTKEDGL